MILAKSKQIAKFSDDVEVVHKFDIDNANKGLIFSILRSKMYSDPIGSICREIASNCRDAHREVGTPFKAVEIELVTTFWGNEQNHIIFRDYGPGLSPDRVANIYTKYGSSTKRNTNDQAGGFGLGCKTPFSYTDSFNVVTVNNGIKYVYNLLIDQTDEGRMALLASEETDEPNMTEVIIPINNDEDVEEFHTKALQATKFWNPVPVFIGFRDDFNAQYTVLEEAPEYMLINDKSSEGAKSDSLACLIDGIYYPVNTSQVDVDIEDHESYCILLKFKNGQLSVSSNRETLNYDAPTVKLLKKVIGKIQSEFQQEFDGLMDSLPVLHRQFFNYSLSRQFTNMDRSMFHESFIIKYRIFNLSATYNFDLANIQYMKPYKVYFETGSEVVRCESIELTRYCVAYTSQPFPIMYTRQPTPPISKCRAVLREYLAHHPEGHFMVVFISPTTLRYTQPYNVAKKIQTDITHLEKLDLKSVDFVQPVMAARKKSVSGPKQIGPKIIEIKHNLYRNADKSYLGSISVLRTGKTVTIKTNKGIIPPEQFIAENFFMPVIKMDPIFNDIEKLIKEVHDADLEFTKPIVYINKSLLVSLNASYVTIPELVASVQAPSRKWIIQTKAKCASKFFQLGLERFGVRYYSSESRMTHYAEIFHITKSMQKLLRNSSRSTETFDSTRLLARKYGIKRPYEIMKKSFEKQGFMKSLRAIQFYTNGIGRYLFCYANNEQEAKVDKRVVEYFSSLNYKPVGVKNV